jgi:hypothetical protein
MIRLKAYLECPPVRETAHDHDERALIRLLQTEQPFGIYLRAFDEAVALIQSRGRVS